MHRSLNLLSDSPERSELTEHKIKMVPCDVIFCATRALAN